MAAKPLVKSLRLLFVTSALIAGTAASAFAQRSTAVAKLDRVLQVRAQQVTGRSRVIVQFNGSADVRAITGQRGVTGRRLREGSQVAEIDNRSLASLAADPRVARVMIDRPAFAMLARTTDAVGAARARTQSGVSGRGVGVAVIDSGINGWHNDLSAAPNRAAADTRVVHFKDFTRPSNAVTESPTDDFGHGTHVAGIIAGNGHDSNGARVGVAPDAHLVGLKVLDHLGNGFVSDVIDALDYAVAVKSTYNIRVINLSVGSGVFESYRTDPLAQAARRAVEAGIVVVAAAGNLGRDEFGQVQYGGITAPGNAPWVLTVGASSHEGTAPRTDDVVSGFSSRGPTWIDFAAKPDVVAPGVGIESLTSPGSTLYSTMPDYLLAGTRRMRDQPYMSLSGTSMAAPVVAGTIALMLEANPSLTPNAVKAILQYTAERRENESALVQGAGLLNTPGAVRLASFFAAPFRGVGRPADQIASDWVQWSRQIIWGNYRISGGLILPGSNAWSRNVTWGALATASGQNVVWGVRAASGDENIVWSTRGRDNVVWGNGGDENIVWSTGGDENIVWSTRRGENIVWGTGDEDNIVWSTGDEDNIVWSTGGDENIVWSTGDEDNIVWSTGGDENIVWSTSGDENIVWSTAGDENIVWSTAVAQNVVWGNDCGGRNCQRVIWGTWSRTGGVWGTGSGDENIVWSTGDEDNIVWSTGGDENIVWSTGGDENIVWSTGAVDQTVWPR